MAMVTLYQRSNGIWYVSFIKNGKRYQRSTKAATKKKALQFLATVDFDHSTNRSVGLQSFIQDFLGWSAVNKAAKSLENDRRALTWLLKLIGNKRLDKITIADIERFKSARLQVASPTTVNIDLRTCKAAFYVAVKWELLKVNVFSKVPQMRVATQARVYLIEDEVAMLLSGIAENWFRDLVMFALNTGMRRGEIVNLRWVDVDMDRRVIRIVNQETFTVKGGKGRVIPMNDTVYGILCNRLSISSHVFTNQAGGKLYDNYIQHRFKKYIRRLGLNPNLHFHHLRHTFATSLVKQGVPIYEVQHLLGHANVTTTQIYSHMSVEDLRSAVGVLDKLASAG